MQPAVYILASQRNGTPYVGVTSSLRERVWEHRNGLGGEFTREHGVRLLVYYEFHPDMPAAIRREKALKEWKRGWKLRLIEGANPEWKDRWKEIQGW